MESARSSGYLMKKKPFKVIISLVTVVAFLFNTISYDLAWAVRTPSELAGASSSRAVSPGIFKELHVDTFALPEFLGVIKDAWSPKIADSVERIAYSKSKNKKSGSNPNLSANSIVIHIQDAHCNYAAQRKISEIIEYLSKEYGINTVNLEGGAKDYDLSIFTDMDDKPIRQKVSDYFVKEGLVNGAEYFAINNPEKVTLWGVEDTKLYIDNLNVYRSSLKHKDEVDRHLKALSYILTNLKIKIYSKVLLDFDTKYGQYKAGNLEFKDYLTYLINTAKGKAIEIKSLTNIYLLNQTLGEEGGISFKKANDQRDDLIDKLQKKVSMKSLEELVKKTVEFKAERMSQKDFYAYLADRASRSGIDLKEFPDLEKYIVYISMYGAIDKIKVMEEIDALENKIKDAMYQNDKERKLGELSKNLAILKNIFNISLSREDYRYYKDNRASFDISNYTAFINKEAALAVDSSVRGCEAAEAISSSNLDVYRDEIANFYEYSFKRDDAFVKNIKLADSVESIAYSNSKKIDGEPKSNLSAKRYSLNANRAVILITGGFHTENLCEQFKKNGIAYVSIMPSFMNNDGYKCPYFSILAGNNGALLGTIGTALNLMQVPSFLNKIGVTVNKKNADELFRIGAEALKYAEELKKDATNKFDGYAIAIKNKDTNDASITGYIVTTLGSSGKLEFSYKQAAGLDVENFKFKFKIVNDASPIVRTDTNQVLWALAQIGHDWHVQKQENHTYINKDSDIYKKTLAILDTVSSAKVENDLKEKLKASLKELLKPKEIDGKTISNSTQISIVSGLRLARAGGHGIYLTKDSGVEDLLHELMAGIYGRGEDSHNLVDQTAKMMVSGNGASINYAKLQSNEYKTAKGVPAPIWSDKWSDEERMNLERDYASTAPQEPGAGPTQHTEAVENRLIQNKLDRLISDGDIAAYIALSNGGERMRINADGSDVDRYVVDSSNAGNPDRISNLVISYLTNEHESETPGLSIGQVRLMTTVRNRVEMEYDLINRTTPGLTGEDMARLIAIEIIKQTTNNMAIMRGISDNSRLANEIVNGLKKVLDDVASRTRRSEAGSQTSTETSQITSRSTELSVLLKGIAGEMSLDRFDDALGRALAINRELDPESQLVSLQNSVHNSFFMIVRRVMTPIIRVIINPVSRYFTTGKSARGIAGGERGAEAGLPERVRKMAAVTKFALISAIISGAIVTIKLYGPIATICAAVSVGVASFGLHLLEERWGINSDTLRKWLSDISTSIKMSLIHGDETNRDALLQQIRDEISVYEQQGMLTYDDTRHLEELRRHEQRLQTENTQPINALTRRPISGLFTLLMGGWEIVNSNIADLVFAARKYLDDRTRGIPRPNYARAIFTYLLKRFWADRKKVQNYQTSIRNGTALRNIQNEIRTYQGYESNEQNRDMIELLRQREMKIRSEMDAPSPLRDVIASMGPSIIGWIIYIGEGVVILLRRCWEFAYGIVEKKLILPTIIYVGNKRIERESRAAILPNNIASDQKSFQSSTVGKWLRVLAVTLFVGFILVAIMFTGPNERNNDNAPSHAPPAISVTASPAGSPLMRAPPLASPTSERVTRSQPTVAPQPASSPSATPATVAPTATPQRDLKIKAEDLKGNAPFHNFAGRVFHNRALGLSLFNANTDKITKISKNKYNQLKRAGRNAYSIKFNGKTIYFILSVNEELTLSQDYSMGTRDNKGNTISPRGGQLPWLKNILKGIGLDGKLLVGVQSGLEQIGWAGAITMAFKYCGSPYIAGVVALIFSILFFVGHYIKWEGMRPTWRTDLAPPYKDVGIVTAVNFIAAMSYYLSPELLAPAIALASLFHIIFNLSVNRAPAAGVSPNRTSISTAGTDVLDLARLKDLAGKGEIAELLAIYPWTVQPNTETDTDVSRRIINRQLGVALMTKYLIASESEQTTAEKIAENIMDDLVNDAALMTIISEGDAERANQVLKVLGLAASTISSDDMRNAFRGDRQLSAGREGSMHAVTARLHAIGPLLVTGLLINRLMAAPAPDRSQLALGEGADENLKKQQDLSKIQFDVLNMLQAQAHLQAGSTIVPNTTPPNPISIRGGTTSPAAPAPVILKTGTVLNATDINGKEVRYEIVCEIDRGGMGIVYEALAPNGRNVAIKTVMKSDPGKIESLKQELNILKELNEAGTDGVVKLEGGGEHEGLPFIAMELIVGKKLSNYIKDNVITDWDAKAIRERIEIIIKISEAVRNVHGNGVLITDLKTDNIMVRYDENGGVKNVTLIDFGISSSGSHALEHIDEYAAIGTPAYFSPEHFMGYKEQTTESDMYVLGLIGMELLGLPLRSEEIRQDYLKLCEELLINRKDEKGDAASYLAGLIKDADQRSDMSSLILLETLRPGLEGLLEWSKDDRKKSIPVWFEAIEKLKQQMSDSQAISLKGPPLIELNRVSQDERVNASAPGVALSQKIMEISNKPISDRIDWFLKLANAVKAQNLGTTLLDPDTVIISSNPDGSMEITVAVHGEGYDDGLGLGILLFQVITGRHPITFINNFDHGDDWEELTNKLSNLRGNASDWAAALTDKGWVGRLINSIQNGSKDPVVAKYAKTLALIMRNNINADRQGVSRLDANKLISAIVALQSEQPNASPAARVKPYEKMEAGANKESSIIGKDIIADNGKVYTIREQIGKGGVGVIWLATDNTGESVAIKCLPEKDWKNPENYSPTKQAEMEASITSLTNEADILRDLSSKSEYVAKYISSSSSNGPESVIGPFIVMEYLDPENWQTLDDSNPLYADSVSPRDRLITNYRICEKLALAISSIHAAPEPTVHRDLKRANIMINRKTHDIKLINFGLSSDGSNKDLIGGATLTYAPPERLRDPSEGKMEGDVYSMGLVMYEIITGEPYDADIHDVANQLRDKLISTGLKEGDFITITDIILECLKLEPSERISAQLVAEKMGALIKSTSVLAVMSSRGLGGEANETFNDAIRSAIVTTNSDKLHDLAVVNFDNGSAAPATFRLDANVEFKGNTAAAGSTISPDRQSNITESLTHLNEVIGQLGIMDRLRVDHIQIIFVKETKPHYGVGRKQIYLDITLLEESRRDELLIALWHEFSERSDVIAGLERYGRMNGLAGGRTETFMVELRRTRSNPLLKSNDNAGGRSLDLISRIDSLSLASHISLTHRFDRSPGNQETLNRHIDSMSSHLYPLYYEFDNPATPVNQKTDSQAKIDSFKADPIAVLEAASLSDPKLLGVLNYMKTLSAQPATDATAGERGTGVSLSGTSLVASTDEDAVNKANQLLSEIPSDDKWESKIYDLKDEFNSMSWQMRLIFMDKLIKNTYGLRREQLDTILNLQLDFIVFPEIESVERLCILAGTTNDDLFVNIIWKQLSMLSDISPGRVIDALGDPNGIGLTQLGLVRQALDNKATLRQQYTDEVLITYMKSDDVLLANKDKLSEIIMSEVERRIGKSLSTNYSHLIELALLISEPKLKIVRKDAHTIYIQQLTIINELFQNILQLIDNNEAISYDECMDIILKEPSSKRQFNQLTRKQRVGVRAALIKIFLRKIELSNKFNADDKKFAITRFGEKVQELSSLYERKKVAGEENNQAEAVSVAAEIDKLEVEVNSLRDKVAPYYEQHFGINRRDLDRIRVSKVKSGFFSMQVSMDMESLQVARASNRDVPESIGYDTFIKGQEKEIDLGKLKEAIRQYPAYLYGDFQDEMIAYLTNGDLRFKNFDDILEIYGKTYKKELLNKIFNDKRFDFSRSRAEIENMVDELWGGQGWKDTKNKLRDAKKLLDEMVDARATLIANDYMLSGHPKKRNDRNIYIEACNHVLGIFQLVPLSKSGRLKSILKDWTDEIESRHISQDARYLLDATSGSNISVNDNAMTVIYGFARNGVNFSNLSDSDRSVELHERQHIIYECFTGAEAMNHTADRNKFFSGVLARAMVARTEGQPGYAQASVQGPAAAAAVPIVTITGESAPTVLVEGAEVPGMGDRVPQNRTSTGTQSVTSPIAPITYPIGVNILDADGVINSLDNIFGEHPDINMLKDAFTAILNCNELTGDEKRFLGIILNDSNAMAIIRSAVSEEASGEYNDTDSIDDMIQASLSDKLDVKVDLSSLREKIILAAINLDEGKYRGGFDSLHFTQEISAIYDMLLFQLLPDSVPVYRSVSVAYAGLPGKDGIRSHWGIGKVGLSVATQYMMTDYSGANLVLIESTVGDLRNNGAVVVDYTAMTGDAIAVVHRNAKERIRFNVIPLVAHSIEESTTMPEQETVLPENERVKTPEDKRFTADSVFANMNVSSPELIAQGAQGAVYLVNMNGKKYAAKVYFDTPSAAKYFDRETKILNILAGNEISPKIIEEDRGKRYVLMEYVDGKTLTQHIKEGLTDDDALLIFVKIARALQIAHSLGVVIRDLKPDNIMIDTAGNVKLIDFGLSLIDSDNISRMDQLKGEGDVVGSPLFMAPEQMDISKIKNSSIDKIDVYALGLILLAMARQDTFKQVTKLVAAGIYRYREDGEYGSSDFDSISSALKKGDPMLPLLKMCLMHEAPYRSSAGEAVDEAVKLIEHVEHGVISQMDAEGETEGRVKKGHTASVESVDSGAVQQGNIPAHVQGSVAVAAASTTVAAAPETTAPIVDVQAVESTVADTVEAIKEHISEEPDALISNVRAIIDERLNAISIEADPYAHANFIQALVDHIDSAENLTAEQKITSHAVIRGVLSFRADSDLENPTAINIVAQIVPQDISAQAVQNPSAMASKESMIRLKRRNIDNEQSIVRVIDDKIDNEVKISKIRELIDDVAARVTNNDGAMGLIYIPRSYVELDGYNAILSSLSAEIRVRIKIQIIEEEKEVYPDVVTKLVVGIKLLDHVRSMNADSNYKPSLSLLTLLAALFDGDPQKIVKKLFSVNPGDALKIRKIDLKTLQQFARAMKLIQQAL